MPPNILLIVLDAARRDAIEPYGDAPGLTPAIADLARRGSALPNAYATASWTLPSHGSMFTGLMPRRLGLSQPPGGSIDGARAVLEQAEDRLITTLLRAAGYATHGISTNLWASGHVGLDRGFESFQYLSGGREERLNALLGEGVRSKVAWATDGLRSRVDDGASAAGDALRSSIAQWSGQPTFWFVNLVECHSPYLPPRPWDDLPANERLRAALEAQRHLSFLSICLYIAGRHKISDEALGRMRHLYRRAIAYMDDWLSGILEALDSRGILDETLVIVTSDHGENFGEDGLLVHGFSVDQRLIHVPLVMAGPGAVHSADVFTLADLPRLLATVAGLERHPWLQPALPDGIAAAQYDPMGSREDDRVLDFARQWQLDADGIDRLSAAFSCATDGVHKLVVRNGVELRYDLESDPDEQRPLVITPANAASFEKLRAALAYPLIDGPPEYRMPTPVPTAGSHASADELAQIERQMKLLGYM